MRSLQRIGGAGDGEPAGWPTASGTSEYGSQVERGEEGFLLLGAIIAIFLVLLVLSVAAPTVARELRREREVEAVHRGNQYVRAIQLYYKKFGHYPGNMEQLEKSNNIRFLRQKYVDPMTGKPDWRLIHVGEQKTTVKGFFGQPLAGIASTGLGSASGMASPGGVGSSPSAFGSAGASSSSGGFGGGLSGSSSGTGTTGIGALGSGAAGAATGATGTAPASSAGGTSTASGVNSSGSNSSGVASQSATSFSGSGAPFVGVGSSAGGDSIVVLNEQTTYPTWEFIYDPRIEQLKAKSNLLGGGVASMGSSGISGTSGLGTPTAPVTGPTSSPSGTTPAPASPTAPQ